MKMLVIAHDNEFSGGANRSLMMVIKKLRDDYKINIQVLVPRKDGEFVEKLKEEGIKVHYFGTYFGVVSSIRNDGKDILRIGKVYIGYLIEHVLSEKAYYKLKKEKFDLVYTNTRIPIIGAKIAKKLNIPHICHAREFGAEKPLWGFWGYKDIYKMSDKIICISEALKNCFAENVPSDKLVTIPNGIDSPLEIELPNKQDKQTFDLILTGRIVPDKGQDEAIEALNILNKKGYKDIILHVIGSSNSKTHVEWYEEKIKTLVSKYAIQDNVIFHGEIKNMISIRKNMDVELMCAIRETFGRVTVEGMRSGLAVIGTNTGGTPEIIIDNETGLLYKQGSANDLADKIEYLYNNRNVLRKLAKKGYEFAQINFTPQKNVDEIYNVIKSVMEERV